MTVIDESDLREDLKEPKRVSGRGRVRPSRRTRHRPHRPVLADSQRMRRRRKFQLADREVVLVTGAQANEEFFRAPDEVLDQAAAYPFMTPVFGEGVVFDTSPEERSKALHNQALKGAT